eukprot:CAMPEP_0172891104 /NCGR_PEP_ID=MMETSP1075-20121228/143010_1 /TAXON_ID=2916 /ORGANISM="Ceratium fusus, Strain PA161109" /LENGTH=259 /DNA_ID=CAMNT_0013745507 /DNA_START=1 /DNA_END=777 /DNA_ORIENTATION=+
MPMTLAGGCQVRRARLIWYGLGATLLALVLPQQSPTFVPMPSQLCRTTSKNEPGPMEAAFLATATGGLFVPEEAWAKGGQWGPLEGKASSLVHPLSEGLLFLVTLYTGFLGWQWRQTRVVGMEISDLRAQVPKDLDPEEEIPQAVKELKAQIARLDSDRKELIKGKFKDRHYTISSMLLGGGIFITFYGAFNTWFRADKLFPGPHLFAGCAIVVLWALAAACVPWMEKGNEAARNAHIALNVLILGLFAWQLPTGWEIL